MLWGCCLGGRGRDQGRLGQGESGDGGGRAGTWFPAFSQDSPVAALEESGREANGVPGPWVAAGQKGQEVVRGQPGPRGPPELSPRLPAGSTPFPYNPLIMRLQAGVMASPPPPGLPTGSGPLAGAHHAWEEEPKPLLCSQYETLSDSE